MPALFQVDAFASDVFTGNPAAVCPLDSWLSDDLLQKIARENNLSETAFLVKKDDGFQIRWFTPSTEVDLCGHATLASAHVLWEHLDYVKDEISFYSNSGELKAKKNNGAISMDFPSDSIEAFDDQYHELGYSLGNMPLETYKGKYDFLCVFESQEDLENLAPDFHRMKKLQCRGVIVTAPGNEHDFVSRFFAPQSGINEDPVTGSAHTTLAVYWQERLNQNELSGFQVSERSGLVHCKLDGNRTCLTGSAKTYMVGQYHIPE